MQKQNSKEATHAEMARIIKAAKKKMFRQHREGMDYGEAVDQFIDELTQDLTIAIGEEVELYGDAVDMAPPAKSKSDFSKVLQSVYELLHNPQTPGDLFEAVAEFVCEQSTSVGDNLFHQPVVLGAILNTVKPDELMGAIKEARQ